MNVNDFEEDDDDVMVSYGSFTVNVDVIFCLSLSFG